EGDPEPVPPDPYHVDNHSTYCSRREAGLEEGYESGSWQEEAGVENCLENKEEWEHESDEETQLQLDVKEDSWEAQTHTDSDQEIEEISWAGVPISGLEESQALSMKPYQDFGSWYEETDSQISEDEARQPRHEAEIHGYDLGVPEKEEAISEAGRNVKESQLALAEEEELESEAGRNVTELEASSINLSGYNKEAAAYQQWEDNLKTWYHSYQLSDEKTDDESIDTWEDFRLEMRRLMKETAAQYHQPQKNDTHALHTSTPRFGLGVRRLITLTAHKRSKGTSENTESKATVVHIKGGPQPEDEAMQQGLQKPPASSNQRTEAKDPISDPHKEITRCLIAKGKQEVTINNFLIPDAPSYHKTTSKRPYQYRGVVWSFLLKGEPPDLPPKTKPTKYQDKALESQKRMKPD
ncbi:unnamed protein product, partial [Brassica napus]